MTHNCNAGEVSEWLKEQPWKGCVGLVPTGGSNPPLSVMFDCDKGSFFQSRW